MDSPDGHPLGRTPTASLPLLGLTVLAVEDSRFASEALRLLCQRSGARLRRADSLAAARRHLRVYRPGCLIVDMGLPDGSGADLLAEAGAASPRVDILLAMSGDPGAEDAARAAGTDAFLAKPIVSLAAFQATILACMPPDRRPPGPRLAADDRIALAPSPAAVGGFAFAIQPAFHKVFANVPEFSLEFDTGADLHYNPTGLLRVHRSGMPPETISDGVSASASYQLPSRPTRSLALGPEWRDRAGTWHALADHGRDELEPAEFRCLSASTARVDFRLTYRGRLRGGATAIAEHVTATPAGVEIEHRVDGDIDAVRQCWPMLATDGARPSVITAAGRAASVTRDDHRLGFTALTDGAIVSRLGLREPCRNGFMDACVAEVRGRTVRSKIEAPADPRA